MTTHNASYTPFYSGAGAIAIRRQVIQLAQVAIWYLLTRHRPRGVPDIFMFGSRRSGTNLIMEVLAASRGVKYCNQPFSLATATDHAKQFLVEFNRGMVLLLKPDEQEAFSAYVEAIIRGDLRINGSWRFWEPQFKFKSDRIVFKITNAPCVASFVFEKYLSEIILLFRHPIAQSLSVMHNKWEHNCRFFLSDKDFIESFLTSKMENAANDILKSNSLLQKHVLGWCLENLALIRQFHQYPEWWIVTYEHFVLNRSAVIVDWARAFGLLGLESMRRAASLPSKTAKLSAAESRRAIKSQDQEGMLGRWRTRIDADEERRLLGVLDVFEIDLYRSGETMPTLAYRPGRPGPVASAVRTAEAPR